MRWSVPATDSRGAPRHIRWLMICLIATLALPLGPLLWELHVRAAADDLQATEDRLSALRDRLGEPRAHVPGVLALAEDLVLRRAFGEVLADLRQQRGWCDDADLSEIDSDISRWFAGQEAPEPFTRLDGLIDAALRRIRASSAQARVLVACGCVAGMVTALLGLLNLWRLNSLLAQVTQMPATHPDARTFTEPAITRQPPPVNSTKKRTPLPAPVTPPVFRPLTIAGLHASSAGPASGLHAIPELPMTRLYGRVLVVEDNPINQRVTYSQLVELGLDVEVVPTAEIGLARLIHDTFDAMLMDLQLPGIDGLAATRQWRAQEIAEGRKRLPIIAITANAMGSDREACFAAGMDGYQAKPARLEDLHRALVRWVPSDERQHAPVHEPESLSMTTVPITPPRVDHRESAPALALLAETAQVAALTDPNLWQRLRLETEKTDPKLLEELLIELGEKAGDFQQILAEALANSDYERLRATAHKLKGSAGMLGLPRLSACAKTIEFAAKEGNDTAAKISLAALHLAFNATLSEPAVIALIKA